jgi:alpha-glucuronidase
LRRQIPAWQKLAKHFYIYEYYTYSNRNEAWKTVKFWSMVSMIREDIRFFQRSGVEGLSSDQWGEGGWYPLNMYAFGKLIWNPDLTADEIIEDFCRRYYGKASDPMITYWNLLEEGLRESWETSAPVNWRDQQRAVLIQKALLQAENKIVQDRIRATFALHKSCWPE